MVKNIPRNNIILVIEDEVDVRNFATRVLELESYRVIQAGDAEEGLSKIRQEPVALILLDLRLPGRDGWSVLEELKNDTVLSSIPVLVFTAFAGVKQQEKALGMGAAGYLVKPISTAHLKKAITRTLGQKGRR